jgi:hypothetical protein
MSYFHRSKIYVQLLSLAVIALLIGLTLGGCQAATVDEVPVVAEEDDNTGSIEQTDQARIIVTRDFSDEALIDEYITVTGEISAMAALMDIAEVETAYGGGFINGINGLRSGYSDNHESKEDWFLFFNGIMSNTGALDYTLNPGDVQHWDYHNWDFRQFIPAIIGDFPEPFLHGYKGKIYPTVVVYQDGWQEEAVRIADTLIEMGVSDTTCHSLDNLNEEAKKSSNLVLVGDSEFELITELNDVWDRLGFFCHFEAGSLETYDAAGGAVAEYSGNTGLIQATQSPWNPKGTGVCENVVWMITGTDDTGVTAAVDNMVENYLDFQYACAVVINGDELIRVP